MNIRIYKTEVLDIKTDCSSMFNCAKYIHDEIVNYDPIFGVVIIDGTIIEFHYSPMGNDGNIADAINLPEKYCQLVKSFVPLFVRAEGWRWK